MNMNDYDVVIVGGGVVGLTSALLLAKHLKKIAIIEAKIFSYDHSDNNDYDLRCSAINLQSQKIFTEINTWQNIVAMRAAAYTAMFVWDENELSFKACNIAEQYLGHIVENRVMLQSLWEQVKLKNNITCYFPETIQDINIDNSKNSIVLDNQKKINASLIVAADGAQSWLRNYFNITTKVWDCGQTAIVATVKTAQSHLCTAWQRFTAEGPLAFLPLDDPYTSTIVWTSSTARTELLIELDAEEFNAELTANFENKLGTTQLISERFAVPLIMRHAEHYVLPRVALVGDAAHVVHPLAGQGLNLGIADAQALAEVVIAAYNKKRDIGLLYTLNKYQRSRIGANLAMLTAMDVINNMPKIRNCGLGVVEKNSWLKRFIIGYMD